MASSCGGGGVCRSQCSRQEEAEEAEAENGMLERVGGLSVGDTRATSDGDRVRLLCSKCGEEAAVYNRLCLSCFRASLFGKFKLAVTTNGMISPVDNVLVAYSGGPASRIALQFIHEMQLKSQKSWDASKDQSLPVFGVGVAFVDESAVSLIPCDQVEEAVDEIRLIVSSLSPPAKELHIVPIESIFSLNLVDAKTRLNKLLKTIGDATGKEDFFQYLRMLSLQKIASDNGYNKLVLGSCTSGIACRIISATVKGQGYSLPADMQYIDARWNILVVLPLRDCQLQELSMLCHMDGLKIQQIFHQPPCGINNLVSSFLARLQEENPSRTRTIVRTAEKLSPFGFNKLREGVPDSMVPSRLRHKLQNLGTAVSTPSEILCPICGGPLSGSDLLNLKNMKCKERHDIFAAHCCASCSYQILPKDADLFKDFYSLLPLPITERVNNVTDVDHSRLREQIEDFLLSDEDEVT